MYTAPYVEFTKPLQDVEVREKESAKFECEVSRESAKVRPPDQMRDCFTRSENWTDKMINLTITGKI